MDDVTALIDHGQSKLPALSPAEGCEIAKLGRLRYGSCTRQRGESETWPREAVSQNGPKPSLPGH